jgi:hypothetical protein
MSTCCARARTSTSVESLAVAARRWAREHDYTLATRSEFDEDHPQRPKVALYVRFDRPA